MKYIFYFLIAASLLFSCKSNQTSIPKDSSVKTPPLSQGNELIAKFKPIIQGVWVNKLYLAKVLETKSPAVAVKWKDRATIDIETSKIVGDSILIVTGDTHDSGLGYLHFKKGKRPNTLKFYSEDLGYSINNGDTTLLLYDHEKVLRFTRALPTKGNGDLGDGTNKLINKILVEGDYLFVDSLGDKHNVKFDESGRIEGFLNFKKYEITIDLKIDPMTNLDEILFSNDDKSQSKNFNYKIIGDTLGIYNSYPNADSTELILGKRVYNLIRQHK